MLAALLLALSSSGPVDYATLCGPESPATLPPASPRESAPSRLARRSIEHPDPEDLVAWVPELSAQATAHRCSACPGWDVVPTAPGVALGDATATAWRDSGVWRVERYAMVPPPTVYRAPPPAYVPPTHAYYRAPAYVYPANSHLYRSASSARVGGACPVP